jgi:hypothetical protein
MTIPSERTRAVLETRKFLRDLMSQARTPDIPTYIREIARALERHYPSPSDMRIAHFGASAWFGPVPEDSPPDEGAEGRER